MADTVSITLTARDLATPAVVEAVTKQTAALNQLVVSGQGLTAATGAATGALLAHASAHQVAEAHIQGTTRAIREVVTGLAQGLSPALAQGTGQALSFATGIARLSGGLGPVTAALGLLALGATSYVSAAREAAAKTLDLNFSMQSLDVAGVNTQLTAATRALTAFDDSLKGMLLSATRTPGAFNVLDAILGRTAAQGTVAQALADQLKLLPIASEKEYNAALLETAKAMSAVVAVGAQRAAQVSDIKEVIAAHQQLLTLLNEQVAAQRKLIDIQAQVDTAEAKTKGFGQGTIDLIERKRVADQAALTIRTAAQGGQIVNAQRSTVASILERTEAGETTAVGQGFEQAIAGVSVADLAAGMARMEKAEIARLRADLASATANLEGQGFEQVGVGPTPAETATGARRAADDSARVLGYRQQLVEAQRSSVGLSKDEQDALTLVSIELQRQVSMRQANTAEEERLVDVTSAVRAQAVLQAQRERNDPFEGLRAGFRDQAAAFGETGVAMQNMARDIAKGMSQSFSDGFFDVVTGNFKALPDVAKQFTNAMVRAVTDALAQVVTAPILGSLKNLLGGAGVGAMALAPTVPAPYSVVGGGSAGSQVVIGQGGNILSSADAFTAYQQGGVDAVRNLAAGGTGMGELPGVSVPSSVATGPSLFARSLPVAGAAAGLGLSAFAASQNTSTPGIFVGAGLGALSGAALGASLATSFPSLGLDTTTAGIGGAVIGAGLNAALAAYSQSQADAQAAKARQIAEATRAAAGGTALVQAAGGATDLQNLFDIITQHGGGATGGSSSIAVPVTVDTPSGPKVIGQPSATAPMVASVQDLLNNPGSLRASIQAGVSPNALAGPNAATSTALQQIATGLANQFRTTEQGLSASTTNRLAGPGGGLQQTAVVPASRAAALAPYDISLESPGFAGLSANDKELVLRDLAGINQKRGLDLITRDPATNGIVSVTMMVPQTLPAPAALPPTTTGDGASSAAGTVTTAQLLAVGGTLAVGIGAQLLDPGSLLNAVLPAGYTGTDLKNFITGLVTGDPNVVYNVPGNTTGVSGSDFLRSLETTGQDVALGNQSFAPGVGDVLGGATGVLGLLQGINAKDPTSIVSGIAGLYSSIAGYLQQANVVTASQAPTITQAFQSVVNAAADLLDFAAPAVTTLAAEGVAVGAEAAGAGAIALADAAGAVSPALASLSALSAIVADVAPFLAIAVGIYMAIAQATSKPGNQAINRQTGLIGPPVTDSVVKAAAAVQGVDMSKLSPQQLATLIPQLQGVLSNYYNGEWPIARYMDGLRLTQPGQYAAVLNGVSTVQGALLQAIAALQRTGASPTDIGHLQDPQLGSISKLFNPAAAAAPNPGAYVYPTGGYPVSSQQQLADIYGGPTWLALNLLFGPYLAGYLAQYGINAPALNLSSLAPAAPTTPTPEQLALQLVAANAPQGGGA